MRMVEVHHEVNVVRLSGSRREGHEDLYAG